MRRVDAAAKTPANDARDVREILLDARRDVVGHGATMRGAYGVKLVTYADWTASGRAVSYTHLTLPTILLV